MIFKLSAAFIWLGAAIVLTGLLCGLIGAVKRDFFDNPPTNHYSETHIPIDPIDRGCPSGVFQDPSGQFIWNGSTWLSDPEGVVGRLQGDFGLSSFPAIKRNGQSAEIKLPIEDETKGAWPPLPKNIDTK